MDIILVQKRFLFHQVQLSIKGYVTLSSVSRSTSHRDMSVIGSTHSTSVDTLRHSVQLLQACQNPAGALGVMKKDEVKGTTGCKSFSCLTVGHVCQSVLINVVFLHLFDDVICITFKASFKRFIFSESVKVQPFLDFFLKSTFYAFLRCVFQ